MYAVDGLTNHIFQTNKPISRQRSQQQLIPIVCLSNAGIDFTEAPSIYTTPIMDPIRCTPVEKIEE
ncbi:hypothetical protein NQ317_011331 [Molorchus minor]|uniref:Uncharacterized protein n=1 Tax=Molorchus minor TaxID=1323400 RepID=A0ABQ9J4K9_9CUCU|nr:hypothetical protein NQ317_011331 [Molorchus minor]